MACTYKITCPFFTHKIPIHDAMYNQNVQDFCSQNDPACAIKMVMEEASFLNVPKDLYPNQTFRVKSILGK